MVGHALSGVVHHRHFGNFLLDRAVRVYLEPKLETVGGKVGSLV